MVIDHETLKLVATLLGIVGVLFGAFWRVSASINRLQARVDRHADILSEERIASFRVEQARLVDRVTLLEAKLKAHTEALRR